MPQTLARHVTEAGRIRIGRQVPIATGRNAGKPRPERLTKFRLTSNSEHALMLAAQRYQGTVQRWTVRPEWQDQVRPPDHAFELLTEADTLDIIMLPDGLMHTSYEQWKGRYCALRCDGQYIIKDGTGRFTGLECQCPSDPQERRALAKDGNACEEVSRICVMLEGLPLGQWRLDTRGFYAPAEIRGLQDLLHDAGVGTAVLRARMRLEQRESTSMVNNEFMKYDYAVVVIEPQSTIDQLMLEGAQRQQRLIAPTLREQRKSLREHIADVSGDQEDVKHAQEVARQSTTQGTAQQRATATASASPSQESSPQTVSNQQQDAQPSRGEILTAIDKALAVQGMTSQQRTQWRGRMCRRHTVKSFGDIDTETLQSLLRELQQPKMPESTVSQEQASTAAQTPRQEETVSAFDVPETDETDQSLPEAEMLIPGLDVEESLDRLRTILQQQAGYLQDATLLECAMTLAADAEATRGQLESMLIDVKNQLDQDAGDDIPF